MLSIRHILHFIRQHLVGLFALSLIASSASAQTKPSTKATDELSPNWSKYLAKLKESEELELTNFRKLRFKPSTTIKLNDSMTYKIVLEDQLGRPWLYKKGPEQTHGPISVHRFYRRIGLFNTPPIYPIDLEINGTNYLGTIQRFIPNSTNLHSVSPGSFSDAFLRQLLEHHLVGWVTLNHQVHPGQFVFDKVNNIVYRIDNSVEWYLLGSDSLKIDYQSPLAFMVPKAGYSYLLRAIFRPKMTIPAQHLMDLAALIKAIPDKEFLELFRDGIKADFVGMGNSYPEEAIRRFFPDLWQTVDKAKFEEKLLARKNSVSEDYLTFLEFLARSSDRKITFQKSSVAPLLQKLMPGLSSHTDDLNRESTRIQNIAAPETQASIDSPVSPFAAWIIVDAYRMMEGFTAEERLARLKQNLKSIEKRLAATTSNMEKNSLQRAQKLLADDIEGKNYLRPLIFRERLIRVNKLLSERKPGEDVKPVE